MLQPPFVAPRNSCEQSLAEIWKELLRCDAVGIYDSFFELGGDSLLLIELIERIRRVFGVQLGTEASLSEPTIAGLAQIIQAAAPQFSCQEPGQSLPVIQAAPTERYAPFPLTDIQEAYWIGRRDLFALGQVSTHGYYEIDTVDLDLDRLTAAWNQVIARHDMLRAIISADGLQRVLPEVPVYRIAMHDLRGKSPQEEANVLTDVRRRLSHQVLPADRWPLFEIEACHLDNGRTRLHLSLDALIMDAWSRRIILREWGHFYHHPETPLAPLAVSFRDYVLAERRLLESELYRRSRQYWWSRLDSMPEAPQLPLAKKPETVTQPHFTSRCQRLSPALWARLRQRGSEHKLTASAVLLAAFTELLRLWSKVPRFTLNLTLFNRLPLHEQVNAIVGDFTSLTMLAVDNAAGRSFDERAQALQRQLLQDIEHRYCGGVRVLREMARRQGSSGSALMPVVFTSNLLHQAHQDPGRLSSWLQDVVYRVSQTPQVWFDHIVNEEGDALLVQWNTVDELFPPALLDDMFAAYLHLLHNLGERPEYWHLSSAEMAGELLPPEQLHQRAAAANATAAPESQALLHTLFATQAQRNPDHAAVATGTRTLSYGELQSAMHKVGNWLRQRAVKPNQLVAIVMEKGWEQVVAALGILAAGAAYLPLDAGLPAERLHHLLRHGEAKLVLTQPATAQSHQWPDGLELLVIDEQTLAGLDDAPLSPCQQPQDLAYVIYTSGSTGLPKGVMIDHRGAVNTILDINDRFAVNGQDRVLALSSLTFDLSVYDIFGALAAGATIVMPAASGTRDPRHWASLLHGERVTVWNSVPVLMQLLCEYLQQHQERLPDSLRLALLSGDWIPLTLPEQIRSLGRSLQVISLGGATEASIWSILYPIGAVDSKWHSIPYGKPMRNQTWHVLDAGLAPRPVWVSGELYIGGLGLAQGYWRDAEKTSQSFINHPRTGERLYRTGDIGRYLPDGNIEFLGREDAQVKIQGFRVELGEIEAALSQHPHVQSAVVAAHGTSHQQKRLVAYVVPATGKRVEAEQLREFLQQRLPDYMVPTSYMVLDKLPLSANGKVDRKTLPEPAGDKATFCASPAVAPAPESDMASRIRHLVSETIKLGVVAPEDNLLSLGATSVDMIRIVNRLESEIGFRPQMNEFYRRPSVRALVRMYEQQAKPTASAVSDNLSVHGGLIHDLAQREAFKQSQPGVRRGDSGPDFVLPPVAGDALPHYQSRRSHRHFSPVPVELRELGRLLQNLAAPEIDGKRKYRYGSAGGLYPVQTYVYVKPGRMRGLAPGIYYYHPHRHVLILLCGDAAIDGEIYDPFVNRPIFDQAAFAIFFIAQLAAIVPIYGNAARDYCLLEAGLMTQLLEMEAPACDIGLCQIGSVDFARVRTMFRLDHGHLLVHSLLGGALEHPITSQCERHTGSDGEPPLSFAQEQLGQWQQLEQGNGVYDIVAAFRVKGVLDISALQRSADEIVRRHHILRTACVMRKGNPHLVVHTAMPCPLTVVELAEAEQQAEVGRLLAEEAARPLDLASVPMLKLVVWRSRSESAVLLIHTHRFVADGWSLHIFYHELSALYRAFSAGEPSPLPALAMQYADFAAWQRQQADSASWRTQLDYWKRQLAGLSALRLPVDYARPPRATYRAGSESFSLSPQLSQALNELARSAGATPFMTMLAALHTLFHRYTSQLDICIATTLSNRSRAAAEPLLGPFGNNLLLRVDCSQDPSFRELLDRVHQVCQEAYANADLPFELLWQKLQSEQATDALSPLQVLFILHQEPERLRLHGLDVSPLPVPTDATKLDLSWTMMVQAGIFSGVLKYNAEIFAPATVRRMLDHFQILLAGIVASPDTAISQLPCPVSQQKKTGKPVPQPEKKPYASPHTMLEKQLQAIWEKTMRRKSIGTDEDFFALGGNSLLAATICHLVEKFLNVKLSLVDLAHYPTIDKLAEYIRSQGWQTAQMAAVLLQPQGNETPLFCLGGAGADAFVLLPLARHLAPDVPVYGLQYHGVLEDLHYPTTVDELAQHFVPIIRRIQPQGPYRLAGSSFGGVVAFAIAHCLLADGQQVEFVGLLDAYAHGYPQRRRWLSPAKWLRYLLWELLPYGGKEVLTRYNLFHGSKQKFEQLLAMIEIGLDWHKHPNRRHRHYFYRQVICFHASANYAYPVYPGRLHLFVADQQPPSDLFVADPWLGWDGLAAQGIERVGIPGYHGVHILEPHVGHLAGQILATLASVATRPGHTQARR